MGTIIHLKAKKFFSCKNVKPAVVKAHVVLLWATVVNRATAKKNVYQRRVGVYWDRSVSNRPFVLKIEGENRRKFSGVWKWKGRIINLQTTEGSQLGVNLRLKGN